MRDRPEGLLGLALLCAALASGAAAQEPADPRAAERGPSDEPAPLEAPAPARSGLGEELVVTGSRLRRRDLTTPAPVTVITREEIAASGALTLGTFLQALPEAGNALNTAVNNGGDGSTRMSLRGLGPQRTLVLLDGRRMVPGGLGADASVDLDTLPTSAVDRVEILKDGASAVYGSDAVAGVVNVITRRRFQGAEVSATEGRTTHGDGAQRDLALTLGTAGEGGAFMLSIGYGRQEPIWASARSFSRTPVAYDATGATNPLGTGPGEYSVDTAPGPQATVTLDPSVRPAPGDPRAALYDSLLAAYPGVTRFVRDPSSPLGWRPYVSYALQPAGDAYNWQKDNQLVTPQERVTLFARGELPLGAGARLFAQTLASRRRSSQTLDAEPLSLGAGGQPLTISADSVYNPFGVDLTTADRRLTELGPRTFAQEVLALRLVAGVDGALPAEAGPLAGWSWSASVNYGRSQATQRADGSVRLPALAQALGPSFVDASGVAHCGTAAAPVDGCVPLDLLGTAGSITPAMLSGVAFTGVSEGSNELLSLQLDVSGDLVRLLAPEPARLAAGYEHRRLAGAFTPDPVTAAGESTGNAVAPTSGGYAVDELYAELSAPILAGVPWAERLEATLALRGTVAGPFGANVTEKVGARWTPVADLTLRGGYATAYRIPSISELYGGLTDDYVALSDPCASAADAPASCGAAAGNGDDRTQLRTRVGGNPALRPETARTFTLGVVLTPRWVKALTVTVDYWRIAIDGAVASVGAATALAACYPADPAQAPRWCDLIERDPASHRIVNVVDALQNAASETASGVDVGLRWAIAPPDLGRFDLTLDGAWLRQHDLTLPDGTVLHGRGTYDLASQGLGGVGGVNPAWKLAAALGWARGPLTAAADLRVVGSFTECGDANGDFSGAGVCSVDSTYQRGVAAWAAVGAQVSYTLASRAGRTTVALGARNLLDATPPRIYNGYYAASDPTAYDYAGRFVYLRLTHAL